MTVLASAAAILSWIQLAVYVAIAVAGVAGVITAAMTREDAFPAADRQPKMMWVALLLGSTVLQFMSFVPLLPWFGIVVIGVYWFDVRPSLIDVQNPSY